jgi:predicted LPLAT superfamily acyltransferase
MSSISQKPIIVLYSYKQGPCEYEAYISTIIHVPPKLGKHQEKYKPYVETFVNSLESFIKDHPYQFFNFFDMWHENHEEPNE